MSDTTPPRTRKPADSPAPTLTPAAPEAKPPKPRRAPRPEIQAMNRIDGILAELSEDECSRVLSWAIHTYARVGFTVSKTAKATSIASDPDFPHAGP